jgi:phosphatidylglycerol:prolipoprotein diacylglycerol transferase
VAWAVTFKDTYATRAVGTPLDVPLHPTQLYESAAAFLIFAFLLWLAPNKRFHGQVMLSYVVLYASVRFVIEFFRGDASRGTVFGALSTSQFLAILIVLAAILLFPYLMKNKRLESPAR